MIRMRMMLMNKTVKVVIMKSAPHSNPRKLSLWLSLRLMLAQFKTTSKGSIFVKNKRMPGVKGIHVGFWIQEMTFKKNTRTMIFLHSFPCFYHR